MVSVLGPRAFRLLRLDRNRNLITAAELERLGRLRIGVVGLSVGHAIAYTLAAQGLCGELRLTDFDDLELSNLNRVPATVFDLGVNKAVVCARRIAELDPYLPVTVMPTGITPQTVGDFLDGLDIVIEECDSLDAKVLIREVARARRLPVLMATSDRGLLDVERFDIEPSRPIMHGLLGDVDSAQLANLSNEDKLPYALRMTDATQVSVANGRIADRSGQDACRPGHSSRPRSPSTRRSSPKPSGALDCARNCPPAGCESTPRPCSTSLTSRSWCRLILRRSNEPTEQIEPAGTSEIVAAAAARAPSGGNAQPWHIEARDGSVGIRLAPEHTTTMDVRYRASAVALGAATFNARVAAAAHGLVGNVDFQPGDEASPLSAIVHLAAGDDPELTAMYDAMLSRETNRRRGDRVPIPVRDP